MTSSFRAACGIRSASGDFTRWNYSWRILNFKYFTWTNFSRMKISPLDQVLLFFRKKFLWLCQFLCFHQNWLCTCSEIKNSFWSFSKWKLLRPVLTFNHIRCFKIAVHHYRKRIISLCFSSYEVTSSLSTKIDSNPVNGFRALHLRCFKGFRIRLW